MIQGYINIAKEVITKLSFQSNTKEGWKKKQKTKIRNSLHRGKAL